MWKGLDPANIINTPSSNQDQEPDGRAVRSSTTKRISYDQKYHPMDQITRPNSSRTLKHRLESSEDSEDPNDLDDSSDSDDPSDSDESTQRRRSVKHEISHSKHKSRKRPHEVAFRRSSRFAIRRGTYDMQYHPMDRYLGTDIPRPKLKRVRLNSSQSSMRNSSPSARDESTIEDSVELDEIVLSRSPNTREDDEERHKIQTNAERRTDDSGRRGHGTLSIADDLMDQLTFEPETPCSISDSRSSDHIGNHVFDRYGAEVQMAMPVGRRRATSVEDFAFLAPRVNHQRRTRYSRGTQTDKVNFVIYEDSIATPASHRPIVQAPILYDEKENTRQYVDEENHPFDSDDF